MNTIWQAHKTITVLAVTFSLNKNTKLKPIIPAVKMQCHTQQELIKSLCAAGMYNSHNNDLQWAFHSTTAAL